MQDTAKSNYIFTAVVTLLMLSVLAACGGSGSGNKTTEDQVNQPAMVQGLSYQIDDSARIVATSSDPSPTVAIEQNAIDGSRTVVLLSGTADLFLH